MYTHYHKRRGLLAPDPEMWQALAEGQLLRSILTDFYKQVYADTTLSPFFTGVTIDRIIDKQYSFLRSIFTGEKCYFGDHPRNAHHWMVISDKIFDQREALMEMTIRRYDLPEFLVQRWLRVEALFRKAIVKDKPVARKIGNRTLPLDGHNTLVLEVSSLCDTCGIEMPCGTLGYYHRRTGKLTCKSCHGHSGSSEQIIDQSTVN